MGRKKRVEGQIQLNKQDEHRHGIYRESGECQSKLFRGEEIYDCPSSSLIHQYSSTMLRTKPSHLLWTLCMRSTFSKPAIQVFVGSWTLLPTP